MKNQLNDLTDWFRKQPGWIREAASKLIENGILTDSDLDELLDLCINPVTAPKAEFDIDVDALAAPEGGEIFRLEAISEVKGINALAPTKPLEFGSEPLCIIFGRNGAGKSGYVRLLKNACGARAGVEVLGNVFDPDESPQSATLMVMEDGETKDFDWTGESIPDLRSVEIYDTACGLLYVDEENEVSYEPAVLRLFSNLTNTCALIRKRVDTRVSAETSTKPLMPSKYEDTAAAVWYAGLTHKATQKEISSKSEWELDREKTLQELTKRLAEADPTSKAAALRKREGLVNALFAEVQAISVSLGDEQFEALLKHRQLAADARKAANEDAKMVFSGAPLSGVGTESWRLLWKAARRYAEEEAYPDADFPKTEDGSRCVLCQRELSETSQERIRSFEEFVRGDLQRSAEEAERDLKAAIGALPDLLAESVLDTKLEAAGISDSEMKRYVQEYVAALNARMESFLGAKAIEDIRGLPPSERIVFLEDIAGQLREAAVVCDEDAKGLNRTELLKRSTELAAQQWLNQQKAAIEIEVGRLKRIDALQIARDRTDTTSLSLRKSLLADQIVTGAYVERFQKELAKLGAEGIPVDIVKTKVAYGHAFHRIQLRNAKQASTTSGVLSEGEFRVVSLAAFLADTEGREAQTPFVFDDPISSLDHLYEEAAARRLVLLSRVRQVLVFTHRLSLVGYLQKYAKRQDTDARLIALSRYCVGETTELPIDLKPTHTAVNTLLNQRLARARKALTTKDDGAYELEAKGLCRDIRVLIERIVEKDLLNEVVKRFSPEINTKGRIAALSAITAEDCSLIDEYMTKYSQYEHSQPDEAPV